MRHLRDSQSKARASLPWALLAAVLLTLLLSLIVDINFCSPHHTVLRTALLLL